jgi:threonylcarbamoyladenosine tRNA methylthiotransferase MtaB
MARGKSRSDLIEGVVANVKKLAANGVKEVVLTGVNLGDFGKGGPLPTSPGDGGDVKSSNSVKSPANREENFYELASTLDKLGVIERYRISSIEPNLLTNAIIQLVANSNSFMPHFHIPLQSGSNRILGLMKRRYRRELYAEKVKMIKTLMPHAAIGVDVIVGFPGETDEDFQETFDFLHELDVTYLHVFTYSERDNTHALTLGPVVPVHVRHERNKTLRNLSYMKQQYFNQQFAGETRKVLFEENQKNGMMEGYTDNYIKVVAPYKQDWVNNIVDWKL